MIGDTGFIVPVGAEYDVLGTAGFEVVGACNFICVGSVLVGTIEYPESGDFT